jgi:hypothetical protein
LLVESSTVPGFKLNLGMKANPLAQMGLALKDSPPGFDPGAAAAAAYGDDSFGDETAEYNDSGQAGLAGA